MSTETSAELRAYYSESWFTAEGARLKHRRLLQAGIPDMRNWRFITLTVENRGITPLEAYRRGSDRMRRFLARLRQAICVPLKFIGPLRPYQRRGFKWCWKLEAHHDDDGYPHWHLCVEYTKRIPPEILQELSRWWGLGRVNVKRINRREMYYVFKYVCKATDELPPWMQQYRGRLRVFQASAGFYLRREQRQATKKPPVKCLVKTTIAARSEWDSRRALLTSWHKGQKRVSAVRLRMTFAQLLLGRAYDAIRTGVPLATADSVQLSQLQEIELRHENRKWSALAIIPRSAGFCDDPAPDWRALSVGHGDFCAPRGQGVGE